MTPLAAIGHNLHLGVIDYDRDHLRLVIRVGDYELKELDYAEIGVDGVLGCCELAQLTQDLIVFSLISVELHNS